MLFIGFDWLYVTDIFVVVSVFGLCLRYFGPLAPHFIRIAKYTALLLCVHE